MIADNLGSPPERSSLRRVLRSQSFRRFLAARTISQWGDTFSSVAIVILVFRLTGSGVKVGVAIAFEIVPVLLFGFVAGVVVDRVSRQRIMVVADLARAAIALVLVLFSGHLIVIYASAFGLSAFSVFFNPAASSVVPVLVPDEADVVGANSAIWSSAVLSQIVLAPVAGGLVVLAGAAPAFAINASSFVVSAVLLSRLRLPSAPARTPVRRIEEVKEGLRTIRDSRFLSTLAVVQALAALSAGATSALLVVLAERHLRVGGGQFGLLIGAIGVGAGLGPLVLNRFVHNVRRAGWLFGPYVLRGLVDLVLTVTTNLGLAAGALAIYGVGTSTGNITYNTVLQTGVDDSVRGRVFAFYDIVWQSSRLVSIVIGGVLADAYGITVVYALGGSLLLAAGVIGLLRAGPAPLVIAPSRSG